MRLNFYTGIAMTVLAADYAAKAMTVDGENAHSPITHSSEWSVPT